MRLKSLLMSMLAFLACNGVFAETFESSGLSFKTCWSNKINRNSVYVTAQTDGSKYMGDVVIPKTVTIEGVEYWVVGVGDEAFKDCTGMTSVKFEGTIDWIGNSAFEGCTSLTEFTIPSYYSDTVYDGLIYLGYRAFWGCHLSKITCMNANPPQYSYTQDPSHTSTVWSQPIDPDWIGWEYNDYWPYTNTSILYVPAGALGDYLKTESTYSTGYSWGTLLLCHQRNGC